MNPSRLTAQELRIVMTVAGAGRATCDRLRTCTTMWTKNNRNISSGYNGSLPGDPHCDEEGHLFVDGHCVRTVHGEMNAVLSAENLSERLRGGTVTILGAPCFRCATMVAFFNPACIEFIGEYDNKERGGQLVKELCDRRHIELVFIPTDNALAVFEKLLNFLQGPGGLFKDLPKLFLNKNL